jgi:iron complex transport system substrate-binding protein
MKGLTATLLALVFLLSACAGITPAPAQTTDQLGRPVRLDGPPQRIVSMSPSNTEILFALGLGDRVVGVTDYCDFPPEALDKPKIGGFSNPDLERVVALSPDLIVADQIHEKEVVPELERRNLPVFVMDPRNLDQVLESISLLGRATGKEAEAAALVDGMKKRIEAVAQQVAGLSPQERPRVLSITWHDPLWTAGKGTWEDQLISMAGGQNLLPELEGYKTVDLEVVLNRDPQIIIAASGHGDALRAPYFWALEEPRLKGTEALRKGRVYEIDADTVSRPGPRLVDGLEEMLRLLHPELKG